MKYRHIKTGNIYYVLLTANKNSTKPGFPPMVVYRNVEGEYFARPLDEFSVKFERVIEL
jgi:hypothetical protein